jgi:hypothetical protein
MITVHHRNNSRSQRVLCLLEELAGERRRATHRRFGAEFLQRAAFDTRNAYRRALEARRTLFVLKPRDEILLIE